MAPIPEATLVEKLLILPQLVYAVGAATTRLVTRPFLSGDKPKSALKDAFYAFLRTNLGMLSIAQEQHLMTRSGLAYRKFMKSQNVQPETTTLDTGLQLHWFGGKTAENTILYFHGGGYVMAASDGHLRWLFNLQKELSKTIKLNIILVEYTLTPRGQYPVQLREAVESLRWLIEDEKKEPQHIIVAGDSAGGNLAAGLLFHVLHPHPEIPTKINLAEPLRGSILISPWVNFSSDYDSIKRNAQSDLVGSRTGGRWSALFMGSAARDNYNQPYFAERSWLKGLDGVVQDILVWGGGGELLIDSIEGFGEKLKAVHPRTELVIEPGAAHEDFIIELILGYTRKADGTKLIEDWLSERL